MRSSMAAKAAGRRARRAREKGRPGGLGPHSRGLPGLTTARLRLSMAVHCAGIDPERSFLSMRLHDSRKWEARQSSSACQCSGPSQAAHCGSSKDPTPARPSQQLVQQSGGGRAHMASSTPMPPAAHSGGSVPQSRVLFRSLHRGQGVSRSPGRGSQAKIRGGCSSHLIRYGKPSAKQEGLHAQPRGHAHSVRSSGKVALAPHDAGSVPAHSGKGVQSVMSGPLSSTVQGQGRPISGSPPSGLLAAKRKRRRGMQGVSPRLVHWSGRPPVRWLF